QPALHPLRGRLLKEALTSLQKVAAATSDADVDGALVLAHEKLGDIFLELGSPEEARRQYEKAAAIGEGQSSSGWGRFSPASANAKLGEACLQMDDIPAAASYCQQGVTLAEQVVREKPDSSMGVRVLAECLDHLGKVETKRGNLQAAV